ncbi:efflux RND transporter permease subunit [Sphingobacterium hungaricum]
MLKTFIERPVLSTVISVLIVLLGVLGLMNLPIAQYPDIAPPTVQVSASYAGANADVVLTSVIIPLEQQINGVPGMSYISSSATNTGSGSISVFFETGVDPDQAAIDVQNRVAAATSLLPAQVIQAGITVRKQQSSNVLIFSVFSENNSYDQIFLQNYAAINLIPQLQRVNGVGGITVFGATMTYSMRIWLKPDVMAIYEISPEDVTAALSEQNLDAAPGSFGENENQSFQYMISYTGRLQSVEEFGNIIIKTTGQGQYLRIKDIARIELGAQTYSGNNSTNGKPSVGIAISQTPGSNASEVIKNSKKVIEETAKSFPTDIEFTYLVDINQFLDASISKVVRTLVECFLLVFLVIFIFLQDFRSTLIHGISVPVSIIGTFFFLYLFGYSINLLTLFALVLAIGIVVDDAIVVVEAVHYKLEHGYVSPRKAAIHAMDEIFSSIIAITLVMAAVFVPVTFFTGSSGIFYKQFGVTLAIAICISAVNALTLCPALAALFLKAPVHIEDQSASKKDSLLKRFGRSFNRAYDRIVARYAKAVTFLSAKKWIVAVIVLGSSVGLVLLIRSTPTSFVPNEDMGTIFANVSLPPASSAERSKKVADQVDSIARTIPEVGVTMVSVGQNQIGGSGSSYAMVIIRLVPWDKRPGVDNNKIVQELTKKTSGIRDANIVYMSVATISGFGNSGGFTFVLQDKEGRPTDEFYKVSQDFFAALNERPEIQYSTTSFNPNFPQYELSINVAKCKDAGILVSDVISTMAVFYGSSYASNFNQFGQQYRVILQADTSYRSSPANLEQVFVKTGSGVMAPITEFITLKRVFGAQSVTRFNLYNSMSVNGAPDVAHSTGESLIAIEEVAAQVLPSGYTFEYSGISREEKSSGSQTSLIFGLCAVFVFLLLSALYESYLLPFAVMLSLPVGLIGVYVFAKLFGIDNNIYIQISVIMLIGLLAKNAILMISYSLERRRNGMSIINAAIEGAKVRLRPILMTSFAFIFGLMPLMFASGVGANGNQSIGVGAIGGMVFGTFFGVFVIPALFVVFETLLEKWRPQRKEDAEDLDVKAGND